MPALFTNASSLPASEAIWWAADGHGSIVSDIQLHKANVARFLQLSRSRSAAVRVARAQVDHETRLRQATDDGLPYSLVGSRDECDFLIR